MCAPFRKCEDQACELEEGVVIMTTAVSCSPGSSQEALLRCKDYLLRPFLCVAALVCEAAHMVPALFQLLLALRTLLQLTTMSPFLSTASGIRWSTVMHLHVCYYSLRSQGHREIKLVAVCLLTLGCASSVLPIEIHTGHDHDCARVTACVHILAMACCVS